MNDSDARKLIDLFLDDELPLELVLEFKQAMFANPELSAEVSALRETQEAVSEAFKDDRMDEAERTRIFGRILAETAATRASTGRPEQYQMLQSQFKLPINEV